MKSGSDMSEVKQNCIWKRLNIIKISLIFFFFKQKTAYEIIASAGVQTCALPISRDIACRIVYNN